MSRTTTEWVRIAHKNNAEKRKWEHKDLLPGSWGYDALAVTICGALETFCLCAAERLCGEAAKQTLYEMAAAIHQAWREIYIFWRDNKPQERQTVNYTPILASGRQKAGRAFDDRLSSPCA